MKIAYVRTGREGGPDQCVRTAYRRGEGGVKNWQIFAYVRACVVAPKSFSKIHHIYLFFVNIQSQSTKHWHLHESNWMTLQEEIVFRMAIIIFRMAIFVFRTAISVCRCVQNGNISVSRYIASQGWGWEGWGGGGQKLANFYVRTLWMAPK